MDDAERRVAVAHVVDEQADGVDVVDLAELRALALHLLPDAVDVLRAALEVGLDAGRLELRRELGDRPVDVRLAALAPRVEELGQLAEPLRLEGLEREVLELPLHLPDPEPLGQRRVDLHRLAGDALLLLRRQAVQRAHVVEPVGELDEDDPDVLGHRQEHLADVLGLLLLVAVGAELGQLGDAVDELGDLGAEALLDVGQAVLGVLGDVVEERRLDGDRVDAELGEDLGRGDRVRDVRLAGRPALAVVGLDGEVERRVDRPRSAVGWCSRMAPRRLARSASRSAVAAARRDDRPRRARRSARSAPVAVVGRGRRASRPWRRRPSAGFGVGALGRLGRGARARLRAVLARRGSWPWAARIAAASAQPNPSAPQGRLGLGTLVPGLARRPDR